MNIRAEKWVVALIVCMLTACDTTDVGIDAEAYRAEVLQWRADRLERLKAPYGYLSLVGLFWLNEGSSSIGSAPDNDLVFPAMSAPYIGELQTSPAGVVLIVDPDADVRHGEDQVTSILISDDTTDSPVTLTHGTLAWTVIKRDERFALRLRDFEHPGIDTFPPLEYFPIDPTLRLTATLRRYDEPRVVEVDTVIEGLGYRPESPGLVAFEINGTVHELEAYASGDSLFYVFGDATTGHETYPAGRFVYSAVPGKDGKTVLDFNKAYNPPCAFNDFATCPVASPRNRLAIRIEAGEKFDPAVHSTPDGH